MENSKQRLYQKLLWQAVNLLSQLPRVCTPYPSPASRLDPWAGRAMGLLHVGGHAPSGCPAFPFVMNLRFRRGGRTVHRTPHFTNRETGRGRSRVISSKLVVVRPKSRSLASQLRTRGQTILSPSCLTFHFVDRFQALSLTFWSHFPSPT